MPVLFHSPNTLKSRLSMHFQCLSTPTDSANATTTVEPVDKPDTTTAPADEPETTSAPAAQQVVTLTFYVPCLPAKRNVKDKSGTLYQNAREGVTAALSEMGGGLRSLLLSERWVT